ncbi:MAG TPA: hypothetical protein VMD56_11715 [Steroidobacteraceae bacterium]|nr:hypothetical protein [Steroidobacteraceae bacterium]
MNTHDTHEEISIYDRMCWPEGELQAALAGGAHRRELIAYFGQAEYRLLAGLARQAGAPRPRRRAARVPHIYLLPGLLGSQLGLRRAAGAVPDLLWLDPQDVAAGRLTRLRQRRGEPTLAPLGPIAHTYLALQLRLQAHGLPVVVHDYDWRHDVAASARALAARLDADPAETLVLVGHSMGGLLARAVPPLCAPATRRRIARLIGLGTPHGGSIGAVQALRATYPVLLRLAALDREHDAPTLTAAVFRSFTSLYQMLPADGAGMDLFDPAAWPPAAGTAHPQAPAARTALGPPDRRRLAAAQRFVRGLDAAAERCVSIVGIGQRTVTGLRSDGSQFVYEISDAGDGTVAAACATLPGAPSYSLVCEHSELPRSARVAAAVIELALSGRTGRLRSGVHASAGRRLQVSDAMLLAAFERKLDWRHMSAAARRRYLNRLNAPPPLYRPRR